MNKIKNKSFETHYNFELHIVCKKKILLILWAVIIDLNTYTLYKISFFGGKHIYLKIPMKYHKLFNSVNKYYLLDIV